MLCFVEHLIKIKYTRMVERNLGRCDLFMVIVDALRNIEPTLVEIPPVSMRAWITNTLISFNARSTLSPTRFSALSTLLWGHTALPMEAHACGL